jgi:hypothetical protein
MTRNAPSQIVEVIVTSARAMADGNDRLVGLRLFDMLSPQARHMLFDTLHRLLEMVRDERLTVVAGQFARVVVFLLEKLRLMGTEASLQDAADDEALDKSALNRSLQASMCDASLLWERAKVHGTACSLDCSSAAQLIFHPIHLFTRAAAHPRAGPSASGLDGHSRGDSGPKVDQGHPQPHVLGAAALPAADESLGDRPGCARGRDADRGPNCPPEYVCMCGPAAGNPVGCVTLTQPACGLVTAGINLTNMTQLGSSEHRQMVCLLAEGIHAIAACCTVPVMQSQARLCSEHGVRAGWLQVGVLPICGFGDNGCRCGLQVIQVGNVNILEYFGAQLVDVIAHDATATTAPSSTGDATNASAYAVLNSLLRYAYARALNLPGALPIPSVLTRTAVARLSVGTGGGMCGWSS